MGNCIQTSPVESQNRPEGGRIAPHADGHFATKLNQVSQSPEESEEYDIYKPNDISNTDVQITSANEQLAKQSGMLQTRINRMVRTG